MSKFSSDIRLAREMSLRDVAREIVIIGFTVVIVTFAALTVVLAIRRESALFRKPDEDREEESEE